MSFIHNPLIENRTEQTLINVQSLLAFMQDVHADIALLEEETKPSLHHGLGLVLRCAEAAITYEVDKLEQATLAEQEAEQASADNALAKVGNG